MISILSSPLAAAETRTYVDIGRLHQMTQWWHWMLFLAVCGAIVTYLTLLYRRDSTELPKGTGILLCMLRLTAFAGLLVFFLNFEKRTERKLVKPSRVAVLVDISQSMGLSNDVSSGSDEADSRLSRIVEELGQGDIVGNLRQKHEVAVYRFSQSAVPEVVARFSMQGEKEENSTSVTDAGLISSLREAQVLNTLAAVLLAVSLLAFIANFGLGKWAKGAEGESWALLAAGLCLIVAVVVMAVSNLRNPELRIAEVIRGVSPPPKPLPKPELESADEPIPETKPEDVDWARQLVARGTETRMGSAVRWIVDRERGGPLAGVVIMTDGRNNAGLEPNLAAALAKEAGIPIYPIGAGSEKMPKSVRVVDLEAPPRVFPGDNFSLTGFVQSEGLQGRSVKVELVSAEQNAPPDTEIIEDEQRITLSSSGQVQSVKFEVTPDQAGARRWTLRIDAPREDIDINDNRKSTNVEVVERKNKVLLLAGGPTREYRFLRNLLYRDQNTTLHVLLQSAPPGAAQEANDVLLDFPDTAEAMFEYDCVVAFDADWRRLSAEQIGLMDRWIADKAGGLILIAGPVFTSQWARSDSGSDGAKLTTVKGFYPVTFYGRRSASFFLGRFSADTPWPLKFSEEGERADFLQLDDSPTGNQQAWSGFEGVYGFHAIRGIKPGARVYASFSDPQAAIDGELPAYMAGQFYGAGRTLYMGSGEMWRLRSVDDRYFETLYTKLIRHVSQGRLLRDSSRGLLLVDKERCSLGDSVTVRATLSDAQYHPLTLPTVSGTIVHESGATEPLTLRQIVNSEREGMYTGQFTTLREGDYRIMVPIPGVEEQMLTRDLKVRLPAKEIERPQRNDALLSEMAKTTGGVYFVTLEAAKGLAGTAPLANRIAAKDQQTYLPGTPDKEFERRLMSWLLALICGTLCLEWLIRRLNKLA